MSLATLTAPQPGGLSWHHPTWWRHAQALGSRVRSAEPKPVASSVTAPREKEDGDAGLVVSARDGDQNAFRLLVERYQQRAFWVARGMLGNDEDARDAAQEAFIRVHRSLERFDTNQKFFTWLYQIVVNLCIDQLRKSAKRRGVSLDSVGDVAREDDDSCSLEGQELKQRVARVLDELPPKYKVVMVLSDLEGVGAKEIAGITGTTHATVRWRHHRARKLFREAWERTYGKGSHVL